MSRQRSNAVFASLQPPKRRVRQVAVGKACVPYFRGAESCYNAQCSRSAIRRAETLPRALRQRACSRKACSFQRGFLQVYVRTVAVLQNAVDERGALQRNAADAAAGKAAVSKRQPGKSPSVSVRFSNRTNSTSVSSSAACENSAARSRKGSIAVVACCVSYQHGV